MTHSLSNSPGWINSYDNPPAYFREEEVRIDDTDNSDEAVSMKEIEELVKRLREKGIIKE